MRTILLVTLLLSLSATDMSACTAAVISGRATPDGRPLLWKHRDTGVADNRLEHFTGPRFSFTGLVNAGGNIAPSASPSDREVWIGANTAGFSIMNTASYNIKDDDVPSSMMDREGILIYRALGICGTIADFENYLDTLSRPLGVEANFGVIDASGGAAVYEVNNTSYVKYDVDDPAVAPGGYLVFTNFSFSGREEDVKGYERYLTASAIFGRAHEEGVPFIPGFITDSLSRSFRHEFMGIDYGADFRRMLQEGLCGGIVPDQDFIPRRSTSASVVVHGVAEGETAGHAVMWTLLGYPLCSVSVPVPVSCHDHIPSYMKSSDRSPCSGLCDMALRLKERYVFRFRLSNGSDYLDLENVLSGKEGRPSLLSCCREAEKKIREDFCMLYRSYLSGGITYEEYLSGYDSISARFFEAYMESMSDYLYES